MFKTAGIMTSGFHYHLIQPIIQFLIAFSYNRMKQETKNKAIKVMNKYLFLITFHYYITIINKNTSDLPSSVFSTSIYESLRFLVHIDKG
jgi:hypothetical protein